MKPTESVHRFEEFVDASGFSVPQLTPKAASDLMQSFYATTVAEGCTGPSSDMLLFQWGTYNWGEGEAFELSYTRQFMELEADGETQISQLCLAFKYPPSSQLTALGEGNRWCESRGELSSFAAYIQHSPPYLALSEHEPPSVKLSHSYV